MTHHVQAFYYTDDFDCDREHKMDITLPDGLTKTTIDMFALKALAAEKILNDFPNLTSIVVKKTVFLTNTPS
jgi:hypothetical protein